MLTSCSLGKEPAGDLSHKPNSMLPLLSAKPEVTFQASEHHRSRLVVIYAALWTEAQTCMCEGCCMTAQRPRIKSETYRSLVHCATMPNSTTTTRVWLGTMCNCQVETAVFYKTFTLLSIIFVFWIFSSSVCARSDLPSFSSFFCQTNVSSRCSSPNGLSAFV